MNSIKPEYKLSHKLILTTFLAFIVSAFIFVLLQSLTKVVIREYANNPEVITKQLQKKVNSLQTYITKNNISSTEITRLDQWMKKEDLTNIYIYYQGELLYPSNTLYTRSNLISYSLDLREPNPNLYTLKLMNSEVMLLINDLFEHRYTDFITYLNLLVFFICFILIMTLSIRKKVAYINILEREIKILEGGNLNYAITIRGNDELSSLAEQMDEMRKAYIIREQYANQMREASNELMTGISHDLRTPLAALIGYLEILEFEIHQTNTKSILNKCKNRALQLNSLLNKMFEYFFVSTSNQEHLQLKVSTVLEALEEIIIEHIFFLSITI